MKKAATLVLLLLSVVAVSAQAPRPKAGATVYIQPTDDGFETFITAAFLKKKVPVSVVTAKEMADYTLVSAQVEVETVSTGRKVVNCLFAYCGGNEDKANTSVTMTTDAGVVVWSYSVNKGRGSKNRQSMAEAIAKHLKDYIEKGR